MMRDLAATGGRTGRRLLGACGTIALGAMYTVQSLAETPPAWQVAVLTGRSTPHSHTETEYPPIPEYRVLRDEAIDGSALLGIRLGRRLGRRFVVEGGVAVEPGHQLEETVRLICSPPLCSPEQSGIYGSTRASVSLLSYELSVGYEITAGRVRPYLRAGLGAVAYAGAPLERLGEEASFDPKTTTTFVGGAGVDIELGAVAARIEAVDRVQHRHFVTGKSEHDLQVQIGLVVPVRLPAAR
jgi:hypothetical protein